MHFGEFLLKNEILDEATLVKALDAQRKDRQMIGQMAVQAGWLKARDLFHILTEQRKGKNLSDDYFGQIAVQLGYLKPDQVRSLLHDQDHTNELLGDILIGQDIVSKHQLIDLLNEYHAQEKKQDSEN